ncbi:MAG: histidine--tRNA ligase [Oscillospiraceae bacterium]|jgi:histidyl-tRNA synthetase|nr:histidine--tRNA ligase [Oscillospiraceae bacterium]
MLTQAPRGTKDILPQDSYQWQHVEAICRETAAAAGYRELRTPIFEHTELFLRGVGDTTDIVQKEMYTFEDKGGRSITLRPEGTAGAVRALVEHSLYAGVLPVKLYYLSAPIFRYEAPQSGRLREHHQFGVECFGAPDPTCDAEIIRLAMTVLRRAGFENLTASINSIGCPACRAVYHEALKAYLGERLGKLCATCNDRFARNPLRILDCKNDSCQAQLTEAPEMIDYLCDDCRAHFEGLKAALDAVGVPYAVNPRIVRGLDYYTRTVFEIIETMPTGALTLCGGGRYDGLVQMLGGPQMPGIGFGMGIERVLMALAQKGIALPEPALFDIYVAALGADARLPAFRITQTLRDAGLKVEMDHAGRSLKAQFKSADKLGAARVVIVGGDELARGTVRVRDMGTKEETEVPVEEVGDTLGRCPRPR